MVVVIGIALNLTWSLPARSQMPLPLPAAPTAEVPAIATDARLAGDNKQTRLVVDLSEASEGDVRVDLNDASMVPELPRRLKVVRITPGRLDAKLEKLAKRRLPVKPTLAGAPGVGYRVAESTPVPDHVEVTGPAKTVDGMKEVSTRPIDLDGLTSTLERTALLETAGDFVSLVPDRVRVSVRFDEILMSHEFPHVPIALRNGDQAKITPSQVDVTVHGPRRCRWPR